jgi:hypothetical protein
MIYPLLVKINFLINKIAFFFAFLQILKHWRLKKIYFKHQPVDILCVCDIKFKDTLASVFNERNDVIIHVIENCSNVKIAEYIYSVIDIYRPRILFTIFEDIDIVDTINDKGASISLQYHDIIEESNIWKYKENVMYTLSALMRFVYIFIFIKTVCLNKNIKLYWCISSPLLNLIFKNVEYDCFKDEKNITMIKYFIDKTEMKSAVYDILQT